MTKEANSSLIQSIIDANEIECPNASPDGQTEWQRGWLAHQDHMRSVLNAIQPDNVDPAMALVESWLEPMAHVLPYNPEARRGRELELLPFARWLISTGRIKG